jgi:hypothetical protein
MANTPSKAQAAQRALIVGVSDYCPPVTSLPAVANDVREMAMLLTSKNGAFDKEAVSTLADKGATRDAIFAGLSEVFSKATANETVFVYFAGHGTVSGQTFFFLPHDVDVHDIENSCVPLTTIKSLFDRCRSQRVFLWLDFCHSGGILARGFQGDAMTTLRRTLEVSQGRGKVIVAACTSSQSALEDSAIGHGLFTHALLRGLKGEAKSVQGEVTAGSLYEFIDRHVAGPEQQPVFFGEMTGRIVLMHFEERAADTPIAPPPDATPSSPMKASLPANGTWIMLGDDFYVADIVRHRSDGSIEVELTPRSGQEESSLAAMRPVHAMSRNLLPFAANSDAHEVQVDEVISENVGSERKWKLKMRASPRQAATLIEMGINGVTADEIAQMRAGRLLVNDPPPRTYRELGHEMMLESAIAGGAHNYQAKGCVIQETFKRYGKTPEWKEMARLKAIFLLKMTGTVEHVIKLELEAARENNVHVCFRGRRAKRYSNREAETIEIDGNCELL